MRITTNATLTCNLTKEEWLLFFRGITDPQYIPLIPPGEGEGTNYITSYGTFMGWTLMAGDRVGWFLRLSSNHWDLDDIKGHLEALVSKLKEFGIHLDRDEDEEEDEED